MDQKSTQNIESDFGISTHTEYQAHNVRGESWTKLILVSYLELVAAAWQIDLFLKWASREGLRLW